MAKVIFCFSFLFYLTQACAEDSNRIQMCENYSEIKSNVVKALDSNLVAQDCRDMVIETIDNCKEAMSKGQGEFAPSKFEFGSTLDSVRSQRDAYTAAQNVLILAQKRCDELKNNIIQTCQQSQRSLDAAIQNNINDRSTKLNEFYLTPMTEENVAAKTEIQSTFSLVNAQLYNQKKTTTDARNNGLAAIDKLERCALSQGELYASAAVNANTNVYSIETNPTGNPQTIDTPPQPPGEDAALKTIANKAAEQALINGADAQAEQFEDQRHRVPANSTDEASLESAEQRLRLGGKLIGPTGVSKSLFEADPVGAGIGTAQTLAEWLAPKFATTITGFGWAASILFSSKSTSRCDTIITDPVEANFKSCPLSSIQGIRQNNNAMNLTDPSL